MNANTTVFPPALERSIQILEHVAGSSTPLSIKEISVALSIPHASAYRMIKCLLYYGLLRESTLQPDKYQLGYKLSYLGKMAFNGRDLTSIAIPYLKELSELTNQACQLSVLTHDAIITIEQMLPSDSITVIARLGDEIPINVSASGKILTSLLPADKQLPYIKKAFTLNRSHMKELYKTPEDYVNYLTRISEQGYGTDVNEYADGIGCVALPIYDYSNMAIAAIGLTGTVGTYQNEESLALMVQNLQKTCEQISRDLGFFSNN